MLNFISSYYMEIIACSAPIDFLVLAALWPSLMGITDEGRKSDCDENELFVIGTHKEHRPVTSHSAIH
jgi:hypothetical protein